MQTDRTALPSPLARDDTLLGVCAALGEDFGFNPFYLRLALGVALLWNPVMVIAGYVAAAMVIAVSRWFVPNPAVAEASVAGEPAAVAARPEGDNDAEALAAAA
ncbi:MAG TPA: PspC domain-containing protein [Allosphingosinicella sp.]|nr:PspC domain-containing protein [Allosphingosinicella sp.]